MISGYTRLAAVIGDPIRHSLSPTILNAAFSAAGLDWRYLAFPVKPGKAPEALEAMKTLGIEGYSVTMPHKAAVAQAVENLTPAARALGAVNCVFRRDGELWGDSTDGDGLVDAVAQSSDDQAVFDDKRVLIVGTGGAGKSIVEAIGRRTSAELFVAGRTPERVREAVELSSAATGIDLDQITTLTDLDIVINATNVGMAGGPGEGSSAVPVEVLSENQTVIDIVYQPRLTPLLSSATEAGATVINGVPMLIHQAALAFTHWTGLESPLAAMTAAVESELGT